MKLIQLFLALSCFCLAELPSSAKPIREIVIFGDSLSDNGNAAYIFQKFPQLIPPELPAPAPPLYTAGRYTNGRDVTPGTRYQGTWVEQLAAKLRLPDPTPGLPYFLDQTLTPGNNFAVAGARTDDGSPASVKSMVSTYIATKPAGLSPDPLYIVFGGANDVFRAPDPVAAATLAVQSVFSDVQMLYAAGARNFLVPNLPDLGTTPRAVQSGQVVALHAASLQYSIAWKAALADARSKGLNVVGVDVYGLFQQILAHPAAFGLTDVSHPSQGMIFADAYLFWDILHPTTKGHSLLAEAADDALEAATKHCGKGNGAHWCASQE